MSHLIECFVNSSWFGVLAVAALKERKRIQCSDEALFYVLGGITRKSMWSFILSAASLQVKAEADQSQTRCSL